MFEVKGGGGSGFLKTGSIEGGQLEITIGKGGKCCKGATDGSSTVVHINGKVLLAKGGQASQNDNGGRGWSGGGAKGNGDGGIGGGNGGNGDYGNRGGSGTGISIPPGFLKRGVSAGRGGVSCSADYCIGGGGGGLNIVGATPEQRQDRDGQGFGAGSGSSGGGSKGYSGVVILYENI